MGNNNELEVQAEKLKEGLDKFTQGRNEGLLRLKDIQIGYTLPENLFNFRKQIRIYVGVQNLLTLTGYSGLDPEVGLNTYHDDPRTNRRDPLDIGIDRGTYPQSRMIYSGMNVSF